MDDWEKRGLIIDATRRKVEREKWMTWEDKELLAQDTYYKKLRKDELILRILKAEKQLEKAIPEADKRDEGKSPDGLRDYVTRSGVLAAHIAMAAWELRPEVKEEENKDEQ